MHMLVDHAALVKCGLHLAGKFILLQSETRAGLKESVKVTLCDLPLHSISNEEVLDAMKKVCSVVSPVFYANLWYNSCATNIHNGDRYVYVDAATANRIPDQLDVGKHVSRVVKPATLSPRKRCGNVGHRQSDPNCLVRSTEEVRETIETFCGGKCELSNLHKCAHGCEFDTEGTSFPTSEQYYQFQKLKAHGKGTEAYEILMEEDPFNAMKMAKVALPDAEVSEEWKEQQETMMALANKKKYESCPHARAILL